MPNGNIQDYQAGQLKKHAIVQFPWDSRGFIHLHQLGGKLNLKERGMFGTSHGWVVTWAIGLDPSPDIGWETINAKG
jgi:hypothetical protein